MSINTPRAEPRSNLLRIPGVKRRSPVHLVPVALALAVVAMQILYPRMAGVVRDQLTVATVIVFATATLSHSYLQRGTAFTVRLAAVALGVGFAAEAVGVRTGAVFGAYRYTGGLGPSLLDVPLVIPLAWLMMAYPAAVMGRTIGRSLSTAVIMAGFALAAWDLFLDPQMVGAGYWEWQEAGPALAGIPIRNYAGWVAVAILLQALIVPAMPEASDDRVPVGLYVWTWLGSMIAHAFYFGTPTVALTGGLAMGSVIALFIWRGVSNRHW